MLLDKDRSYYDLLRVQAELEVANAEIGRLQKELQNCAFRADQVITEWEIAHNGKMIFGELWRTRMTQVLKGE